MPGPAGTESRRPPAMTTRVASFGPISPITLLVRRRPALACTSTSARWPASPAPASRPSPTTGIPRPNRNSEPGVGFGPSLTISAAAAPARRANAAFWKKKQSPRRIKAMSPAGKPEKSPAEQPSPTVRIRPVARPAGENCSVRIARSGLPSISTRGGRRSS